ncbi:MAG: hypothetical protein HYR56_28620 [Acidobacteria bacterium]|nr:hypothetical protein [Acidobacteriota bacterium]MBI3423890.1 hypothetical protein [Acidobacteriota bacterium]
MARGWESKAIEEQQAEAARGAEQKSFTPLTPEELVHQQRRENLQLSRSQLREQLQGARNDAQRRWLENALQQLEAELAQLDAPTSDNP